METETNVLQFDELRRYSTAALVQAVITLTHCVVNAEVDGDKAKADNYRERREVATRELIRRADR